MVDNFISGTVTMQGDPVANATVKIVTQEGDFVARKTTDSNGDYTFNEEELDSGINEYHVMARYEDEGDWYNALGKPWVEAEGFTYEPVGNPIHFWPHDEGSGSTLNDVINGADGNIRGATWDNSEEWVDEYALDYPTTDDDTEISSNQLEPGDSGTMILTVRVDNFNWDSRGYMFGNDGADSNDRFYMYCEGTSSPDFSVGLGDEFQVDTNIYPVTQGELVRYAIRWDTGDYWAYINGNLESSGSYSSDINMTAGNWYFGTFTGADTSDQTVNGVIDAPQMYTDTLSDTDLQEDYDRQPWS